MNAEEFLGAEFSVLRYSREDWDAWEREYPVEVLVPGFGRVTAELIERLPDLRLISAPGTGVWDYIDVPAATRKGILVANIRDYAADTIAEYTIGLAIVLNRKLLAADAMTRSGSWRPADLVGADLRGKTFGVIGLGSIGRRVAELASAFGMEVICATGRPDPGRVAGKSIRLVALDELLREADVISLHAALTEQTRGMLGEPQFQLMKPTAVLINTARGGLVVEPALVTALQSKGLAGAALDVFDPEPLPNPSPLTKLANVILTPHIAAATAETLKRGYSACLDNVRAFGAGNLRNCVNAPPGAIRPPTESV